MNPSSRLPRFCRAIAPLLATLLLLGQMAGALHHHADAGSEDSCAVCTLAHSAADAPAVVLAPAPSVSIAERVLVPCIAAHEGEARYASSPRAPPLA